MARYLTKDDRSDSVSWMNFDGAYPTIRRDFSRAVDSLYRDRVSNAKVKPLHTVIVSFHPDELNPKRAEDVELARLLAQSWTMEMYPGRPAIFAVQSDGKGHCLHVHIAVSNVGADGRCLDKEKSNYRTLTRSFTEHMASFGMEDVLHDEAGAQRYTRDAAEKASRFDDVHEKARTTGLNSWKEILSIRLDSVLLVKPSTPEDFEAACARAGVVIRQPRGKGNKSWCDLKNWGFALAEMDSKVGMEQLQKTGILTDPKTKIHFCTDRGLGGTGKYSREGIMEALGWGGKPVERTEEKTKPAKGVSVYDLVDTEERKTEPKPEPKPVAEAVSLYDLVDEMPEEKPKEKQDTTPVESKQEIKEPKEETMEDKFDPAEIHKQTVASIYRTAMALVDMGNGTIAVDEAVKRATSGSLAEYRGDVLAMYQKEHPETKKKTAAKPATEAKPKQRSEQRSKKPKQQQTQYKQQTQQSQQKQTPTQKLEDLSPEEAAYVMARDDALQVLRRGEQNFIITLFTWWNLMAAERALIKAKESGTDEQMEEMRAADEAEYNAVKNFGSNKFALETLARRTKRDLMKSYREGRRFLKRITTQEIKLTPEQKQMRDELQLNIAKRQQQGREMEL